MGATARCVPMKLLANVSLQIEKHSHQAMSLGTLEVIRAVQRIEPRIKQEFRPIALTEHKTSRAQSMLVLRQNEVDLFALQVLESGNNTVRWNNRLPPKHCLLQLAWLHDVLLNGDAWVHDQGVLVEVPEVFGVWV